MIDVIVVVVVVSCTSSCKEVGPKWRRVFGLICCVTVDRRCLLGQGPLHNMTLYMLELSYITLFQPFQSVTENHMFLHTYFYRMITKILVGANQISLESLSSDIREMKNYFHHREVLKLVNFYQLTRIQKTLASSLSKPIKKNLRVHEQLVASTSSN